MRSAEITNFTYKIPNLDNEELVLKNPPTLAARFFAVDMMCRNIKTLNTNQLAFLNHIKAHQNVYGIVIDINTDGDIEPSISSYNAHLIMNHGLLWLPFVAFGQLLSLLIGFKELSPTMYTVAYTLSLIMTVIGIIGIPSQMKISEFNKKRFWIWYPLSLNICFLIVVFFVFI